jgi:hypothetical protein
MKSSKLSHARLLQPEQIEATEGRVLIWMIERMLEEAKRRATEEASRLDYATLHIQIGPETMPGYGAYIETKAELHVLTRRETDPATSEALQVVATMMTRSDWRG